MAATASSGMATIQGVGDIAVVGQAQVMFVKDGVGIDVLVTLHDAIGAPADKARTTADEVAFAKRLVALL